MCISNCVRVSACVGMCEVWDSKVVSISVDGTAQHFDPWSSHLVEVNPTLGLLKATKIDLPLKADMSKVSLRGVAPSTNGTYTCVVTQ